MIYIYIYIYYIQFFKVFFQLNRVMSCYDCVQLIKFIYIYILMCICFVSNKVLLKVITPRKENCDTISIVLLFNFTAFIKNLNFCFLNIQS